MLKCKRCGCELPAEYKPFQVGALRLIICDDCMTSLAALDMSYVNLWQYNGVAEPEPECQRDEETPGLAVRLAFLAGCSCLIVIAGLLIGYLAGGL